MYRTMWGKYRRWLEYHGVSPAGATPAQLAEFFEGLSFRQRPRYFSLLRRVYRSAVACGLCSANPLDLARPPVVKSAPGTLGLSPTQRESLVAAMRTGRESANESELRNHALVALFLGAGVRVEEIARVELPTPHVCCVPEMKGRPARVVPVETDCAVILSEWLARATNPLFPSSRGGNLSASAIWRGTNAALCDTGIQAGPEELRTTWIVRRLAEGYPDGKIAELAGIKERENLLRYKSQPVGAGQ